MNKKVLIILNVALVLIAAVLVCLILGVGQKDAAPSWQEQYDLGIRYYSEGDYDAAVLAFRAAINIDPTRPEAYQGAAQAYIALGNEDAAAEILEDGYENTGDESMKEWIDWYDQTQEETAIEAVTDATQPEATAQEPGDVRLYGDVLKETNAETKNCGEYYDGYGTLYDLDGNGTQELVIHYIKKVSNEYGSEPYEHSFAAIYTIHDGEVVQLVDEKLVGLVAGPSSSISIVEKNGKTYALTTWETGGTDGSPGCERYGEYRLYAVDGNGIIVDTFAEYFWVYGNNFDVNYSNSYAVIDGTRTGYGDLEQWAASFREIARFEEFYWDEEAPMTLEELLAQIRG